VQSDSPGPAGVSTCPPRRYQCDSALLGTARASPNCALGDPDGKTLLVTAGGMLRSIRVQVPGRGDLPASP
jgi:hypothetical protein